MYCEFFGLTTAPFNNTPDPRFFFNTPDHEEALASLLYTVEQRKGFVLVTGEVGSGKTLLSRTLLNRLGSNVRTALITNTRLSAAELLEAICREFELDVEGLSTTAELSQVLEGFLLEQYARNRLAVVILDEAQNLPAESLEELRMLGNLEADDAKLLQVLILGQPELHATLRQPSLRQTIQRVFRTFHLKGLDRQQTESYITHRLEIAGLPQGSEIWEPGAFDAIYKYSEGIPRLINQICDDALLAAYSESSKRVSPELIAEIAEQITSLPEGIGKAPVPRASLVPPQDDREQKRRDQLIHQLTDRLDGFESAIGEIRRQDRAVDQRKQDELVKRLSERLNDFESTIDEIKRKDREIEQQKQDALVKRLTDRLDEFESTMGEIKKKNHALDRKQHEVQNDLGRLRKMQQSAASMLSYMTETTKEAETHMKEMLGRAQKTAKTMEERAAAASEEHSKLLQKKAEGLVKEVEGFTETQEAKVSEAVSQSQTELEALRQLRQEGTELYKKIIDAQQEHERRISLTIDEAHKVSERLEAQANKLLGEARAQNNTIQGQFRKLLEEIRTKGEASQARAAELLSQQHSVVETSRQSIDEFNAVMKERSAEVNRASKETLNDLKTQATSLVEQIHGLRDRTQSRAEQVHTDLGAFIKDMQIRIQSSHDKINQVVTTAETEVQSACASIKSTKEQVIADAQNSRTHASKVLDQTHDLLTDTREQCTSLLTDLRKHVTEQTEKVETIWKSNVSRGSEVLNALNASLAEARKRTDRSKAELEELVQNATGEVSKARNTLESSIESHNADIAKLSKDATAIKTEFLKRFEEVKAALDTVIEKHRGTVSDRLSQMSRQTNQHLSEAESLAKNRIEKLKAELTNAAKAAEGICDELKSSVDRVQSNAARRQSQVQRETENIQRRLTEIVDKNRTALAETRSHVETLSKDASETAAKMRSEIETIKQTAQSHVSEVGTAFEAKVTDALARTNAIRAETETKADQLAERLIKTNKKAEKALADTETAASLIRQQSQRSLAEVRACLSQMNERSDLLRRDLTHMGDEVRVAAETTTKQLQQTGERVAEHIESMRETAQRDADANHKRLSALRLQVEQSAEQMRQNAGKLLDQVQSGTASLRQHADDLMAQAESGSEKINESAATLLTQAQTAAECFREQAEGLLHRAEKAAGEIRNEVQDLRSQVSGEAEQIRQQIVGVKNEMAETRQDSSQIIAEAIEAQKKAESKTEQFLERAESVQQQTEALLKMPKEIVEESKRQAHALSDMSTKISKVVKQLNSAGQSAERNKQALEHANGSADEKLGLLKRHTERVGQLVGIIRQLYGTMDARIAKLRGRLSQADDLFRNVPQEIERLRSVFDADIHVPTAPVTPPQQALPSIARKPQAAAPTPKVAPKPKVKPPKGSLGDIVQRNQKLNEWLQTMLNEETVDGETKAAAPNRAAQPQLPSKT